MSKIEILISYTLLALMLINHASALKCWTCHSTTEDHDFCGAVFDKSSIPNGLEILKVCNETKPDKTGPEYRKYRPVCRKDVKKNENGEYLYTRACHFIHEDEPLNQCGNEDSRYNGKRITCLDCTTDACNVGTISLPIFGGVIGSIIIAKLLTL